MKLFGSARGWFLAGLLASGALPLTAFFTSFFFAQLEPFFAAPIPALQNNLKLRNDTYGKGYFGAARNGERVHEGIDLSAPIGERVLASKSGRVLQALNEKGYGLCIHLIHPDGRQTLYAHLSSFDVKEGQWVKKGQIIGHTGKTGNANHRRIMPHLHFEIREDGKAADPQNQVSFAYS